MFCNRRIGNNKDGPGDKLNGIIETMIIHITVKFLGDALLYIGQKLLNVINKKIEKMIDKLFEESNEDNKKNIANNDPNHQNINHAQTDHDLSTTAGDISMNNNDVQTC